MKIYKKLNTKIEDGFSLVELLIVLGIIGILAGNILPVFSKAKEKAYLATSNQEIQSMLTALELYKDKYKAYPPDVNRDLPAGLSEFMAGQDISSWPDAQWPGSVYDWDNWDDPDLYNKKIYQISIRFCPAGGPLSACRFPKQDWAENFNINSSAYYCIQGNCRSHINEDIDYPGHCLNC